MTRAHNLVALAGRPCRVRRVHRLRDRGQVDEAGRVIAALRCEQDAVARWREGHRP